MATRYTPGTTRTGGIDAVRAWVADELRRVADALKGPDLDTIQFEPQAAEPSRRREGLVHYADGTNWNPGAGAGLYEYRAGAWQKL